jgi:hypothetical protein
MISDALSNSSIVGKVSMFIGILPLSLGVVYALWPSEQRLALLRPLSLATIFGATSGTVVGLINVFMGINATETSGFPRLAWIGLSEALVPIFFGFGCLTVTWFCVAFGLWRRP